MPYLDLEGKSTVHDAVLHKMGEIQTKNLKCSANDSPVGLPGSSKDKPKENHLSFLLGPEYSEPASTNNDMPRRRDILKFELKTYIEEANCDLTASPLLW